MNITTLNRISKVIQTEATTSSKADFLLTHLPFENLFLENGKSISENDLLRNVLLKNQDEHKFIMVQGGNGSGKSHLIRWLKEKYQSSVDKDKEAILLISRAHNTLQDALTQLLDADIFPDEIKENELKHIKNAKSNITGEELNKTINFNFTLEIDADEKSKDAILDARYRKWLSTYMNDNYIRSEFLLTSTGPIERIRSKIETTNDDIVISGDDPVFVADDFNISIGQIKSKLNVAEGRAADFTIRLAEKLADTRTGPELRQKVAEYLNTKVSSVIQRSMKLQTADFKKLFANLRRVLKSEGINLTLFVEDINSFTGIDEALMEVLLTDHNAEGNSDYCRIISVVGSTNAFYRDKLNASIKERIKTNIFIQERSVLGTQEQLCKFAAKYINAINLSDEAIKKWENNGLNDTDFPVYESPYNWANVDCNGSILSIFPFNSTALWKLYSSLSSEKKTPRVFLKSVISHVLKLWYSNEDEFLSDENNFSNADISIPNWNSPLYIKTNEEIDENSAVERGILLRLWGDGTAKIESGRLGGLTEDIFKTFKVYSGISGEPKQILNENLKEPIIGTTVNQSSIVTSTKTFIAPSEPTIIPTRNPKLDDIENDLLNWLNPKDPTKNKLANHIELRELVSGFIVYGIDWELENVPNILVDAYINTRGRVHIEGQTQAIGDGLYLNRTDETYYLLTALAYYKYAGNNTWYFDGGEDYLVTVMAWLEKYKKEIINTVVAPKNQHDKWNLPLWNVASLYCIRTLFGGVDISKSSEDISIELLSSPANFSVETTHSTAWKELQGIITKNDKYKNTIYNETIAYFSKSVGGAEAGSTSYTFVDALSLIKQVRQLKALNWQLDGMCPSDVENYNSTWYYSATLINIFCKNINRILLEEDTEADKYLTFFGEAFDNNFEENSVAESLQAMRDFLQFLTNKLNLSYTEDDYKVIKPANAAGKLVTALNKVQKLKETQKSSETIMRISKNPFDEISKFYSAMLAFNKLLNDKGNIFSGYVDTASKEAIESYRNEIIDAIDDITDEYTSFGGDTNGYN